MSGHYHFDGWDVRLPPDTDPRVAQMLDVHEALHVQLDESTAFGALLNAVAFAARNLPGDERLHRLLDQLVAGCRLVHESYATYLSLLVVGDGQASLDLLADNPLYRTYHDQGAALAVGLSGGYLRRHAVGAALRACMQGDAAAIAVARGLDNFRPADLRGAAWPDAILRRLAARLRPDTWTTALEQARQDRPDLPGWDAITASEADPGLFRGLMREEYDVTSDYLLMRFHAVIQACIPEVHGFDDHLPLIEPLIAAAERRVPAGRVRMPLRAAPPGATPEVEIVRTFKGARVILRSEPLNAALRPLPLPGRVDELVTGVGAHAHLFVVARHADRMQEQHAWPGGGPPGGAVTAIRRAIRHDDGSRTLEYYVLPGPDALDKLLAALPAGLPVIASVSMAVFGDEAWSAAWLERLDGVALLSVLIDVDPYEHLERWSAQPGLAFDFATMLLPDDHVPNRVFTLRPAGSRTLLLAPCSHTVAQSLVYFIRTCARRPDAFREDTAFLAGADRIAVGVLLGHLLHEETFFDFTAGHWTLRVQP